MSVEEVIWRVIAHAGLPTLLYPAIEPLVAVKYQNMVSSTPVNSIASIIEHYKSFRGLKLSWTGMYTSVAITINY